LKASGSDYTVVEYIQDLLDNIIKRVRDIPPFKRRVIDMKAILTGSVAKEEAPA